MRVLVTGCNGQVGRALVQVLDDPVGTDRATLDIGDPAAVADFDWLGVDAIVNAAAFTQVDRAEETGHDADAWRVNATGVLHLARVARERDIPLVHISSDYVFDGTADTPLPTDAPVRPLGVYGATKAAGEHAARLAPRHYIVRTAWVFGEGPNFARTMLRLAETRPEVAVVADQRGRPTSALHLAEALARILTAAVPYGTYHVTGTGPVLSWADFASEVFAAARVDCRVRSISSEEYARQRPGLAPRPAYSALDTSSAEVVGLPLHAWRDGLQQFLAAEGGAR
jgi:dTDP-4-dehydrorhamnose reductase